MERTTRRAVLRGGGSGGVAALAGCLGRLGGGASGGSRGLTLDTFDVGGSPGTTVPVVPEGSVVLLDFWATWCAPCKPQMKTLRAVHEQFPEVHMLSITNENDDDAIKQFWQDYGGTWAVAKDPDLTTTEEFSVTGIPTLLVFDPKGNEVWRHVGLAAKDSIVDALRDAGA